MNDMTPPKEQVIPEGYRAEAASWSQDVNASLRASRSRAWWVAAAAGLVALLQAAALVALLPLKTVVPYTITVDHQTGEATLARGVNLGPMSENEALVQSALAQYVIARETLDATDLAANFRKVGLWSSGSARRDYLFSMDRANPASVLNSANAETLVTTTIRSITILDEKTALVRFATDRRQGDGPITRQDWLAVIKYGFSGKPLSLEDRLINPLGFQVSHYRRDAESIAAGVPTSPPDAAAAHTNPRAETVG